MLLVVSFVLLVVLLGLLVASFVLLVVLLVLLVASFVLLVVLLGLLVASFVLLVLIGLIMVSFGLLVVPFVLWFVLWIGNAAAPVTAVAVSSWVFISALSGPHIDRGLADAWVPSASDTSLSLV